MLILISLSEEEPVALTDEPPVFCEQIKRLPTVGVQTDGEKKKCWPGGARLVQLSKAEWEALQRGEDWKEILDAEWLLETADRFYARARKIAETSRLLIRELRKEDAKALMALYDDDAIRTYVEPLPKTQEEVEELISAYIRYMYEFYGFGIWAAEEKTSGKLVGRVGFEPDEEGGLSLGYLLGREYRGKGYAEEMCKAALEYVQLRGIAEKEEIRCHIAPDNQASCKLAEKLGITICMESLCR